MNEKMIEAAIEGNFSQFSDMLKEELNRRVHELIESRIQDVTDDTWNVCESCDEDDVWDDEDIEDLYHNEEDPYEDEEDLEGMNIGEESDDHGARELHLYADNHADLHRQRMTPIHKNLRNKMASGKYDHEKAKKLFKYAADDAAKRYKADHGHHFDVKTRKAVASKMADEFHSQAKGGEHDHLLHKKHKGHKVESVDHTDEAVDPKIKVISRGEHSRQLKALGSSRSALKKMRMKAQKTAQDQDHDTGIDTKKTEESVEIEEGAPGQNPLKTTFGGMKAAQDTPSFKKYQARLKAEREARKREFERDQAAKKGTREEVEVDEAMGGKLKDVRKQAVKNQKKRKKGEKLAKKDHDGDGKIETGSQEFLGSRDRAIKAAMAARRGN